MIVGATSTLDTSGSYDFDNSVVAWTVSFGDGTVVNDPIASHIYASAGSYTATLDVEDADGLVGSTTCAMTIAPSSPPVLAWITPDSDIEAQSQGWITLSEEAVAASGRSVLGVDFIVGGVMKGGTDVTVPYSVSVKLPTAAPGAAILVTATAVDSLGEVGTSAPRTVTITE
ncbi:MAG: PKD domain-containing protein [Myxococcales bacterium]|nr:PKD domain-containing protein [Myxococcales bacterium]